VVQNRQRKQALGIGGLQGHCMPVVGNSVVRIALLLIQGTKGTIHTGLVRLDFQGTPERYPGLIKVALGMICYTEVVVEYGIVWTEPNSISYQANRLVRFAFLQGDYPKQMLCFRMVRIFRKQFIAQTFRLAHLSVSITAKRSIQRLACRHLVVCS